MITVKKLCENLDMRVLCEGKKAEKEISGCCCGDLLSFVMTKAKAGDAWLTVMGNINTVGVAALTDVACIILTDSSPIDEDALLRANQNGITILQTEKSTYEAAVLIHNLIGK